MNWYVELLDRLAVKVADARNNRDKGLPWENPVTDIRVIASVFNERKNLRDALKDIGQLAQTGLQISADTDGEIRRRVMRDIIDTVEIALSSLGERPA